MLGRPGRLTGSQGTVLMCTRHVRVMLSAITWSLAAVVWAQPPTYEQRYSIPDWVNTAWVRSGLDTTLEFDTRLNPYCHRGDFDGDGRRDFVVLISERASGKKGIAFVHRATGRVTVLGAGRDAPNVGDDFSWMDAWTLFDKGKVPRGATEEPPPTLIGDALLVFKTEAASGILWWDGSRYRWYQQGD